MNSRLIIIRGRGRNGLREADDVDGLWSASWSGNGSVVLAEKRLVSVSLGLESVSLTRIPMPLSCSAFSPEGCSAGPMGGQSTEPTLLPTGKNAKERGRDDERVPGRKGGGG
jgi:hypothetical protein